LIRLKEVNLLKTRLSSGQLEKILQKISTCEELTLSRLDISYNDISGLPEDVLIKAISRMEKLVLKHSNLSQPQLNAIAWASEMCNDRVLL